jgi:hypothetical protein
MVSASFSIPTFRCPPWRPVRPLRLPPKINALRDLNSKFSHAISVITAHKPLPSSSRATTCSKRRPGSSTRRRWRLPRPLSSGHRPRCHHSPRRRLLRHHRLRPHQTNPVARTTTTRSTRPTTTRSCRVLHPARARHHLRGLLLRRTHGLVSFRHGPCPFDAPRRQVYSAHALATRVNRPSPHLRSSLPSPTTLSYRPSSWWRSRASHLHISTLVAVTGSWTPAQVLTWQLIPVFLPHSPLPLYIP